MTEDTILMGCSCGSSGGCSTTGCTGDATTCSADPCCRKGDADSGADNDTDTRTDSEAKSCPNCGSELKSGLKYTDICLECEPAYKARCSGCQRILWDCMCIKPHTWE
ncbi:MAG: hypothetical protein R3C24_05105 [Cyanobacteriota/Melainabacteria group bacterium]|nr:hypothetical protein [Cyanobacteria bacterium HKST-UBA01]